MRTISFIVFILLFSGCSALPPNIAPKSIGDIISSVERKAQEKIFEKKPQANFFTDGFLQNEEISKYVNRIWRKLALGRESGYERSVSVLKTSRVQAFTDWWGEVYITRGMLNMIDNEDELACLIGHEIGHHMGKSWERRKDNWQGNFLSKTLSALGVDSQWKNEILEQQKDIYEHGWGKEIESEADRVGVGLAAKAGYDPYALCDLFERLSKKVNADLLYRVRKLKGTHPALDERAVGLRQYLMTQGYASGKHQHHVEDYRQVIGVVSKPADLIRLEAIQKEIKESHVLSPARFIVLMQEISNIANRFGIDRQDIVFDDHVHFMEEEIYQDHPFGGQGQDYADEIKDRLKDILILAGQITVGSIPLVGNTVSFYEVRTGKDFYSGEKLSIGQRSLSCFGVFIGCGSMWRQTAVGIEREIADNVFRGKVREAAEDFAKGKEWKSKAVAKDGAVLEHEGDEVNEQLRKKFPDSEKYQNSYKPGSKVYERIMVKEEEYVRFIYPNEKGEIFGPGQWIIKRSEVKNRSPEEIKEMLALPEKPTHWATVKTPPGTKIREGITAQNSFGKGGARQVEVISEIDEDWFSSTRKLEEVFND